MNLLSRIRRLARVRPTVEGDLPEVAETVAIIMDGNGRWARRRGLPTALGHRAGTRALRRTVEAAIELGIRHMVVYAFSTENWSRPQDEVDALMEIFGETIERELPDLAEQGVRVRFIGRRDRAPERLRLRIDAMEDRPSSTRSSISGSRSITAAVPSSSRPRGGSPRAGSIRARSTRTSSRRTCTRPSCPIPTC